MNNDEYSPEGIHAQRDEPLLAFGIRVFDRSCHRISQCLLSMRKTNAVLAQVGTSFDRIELERHSSLCILYAYAYHRQGS